MSKKTSSYYSQPGMPAFPGSYYKAPTTEETILEQLLKTVQKADETRHDDDEYLAEILEKIQPDVADIKAGNEYTINAIDALVQTFESKTGSLHDELIQQGRMVETCRRQLDTLEKMQDRVIQSQHHLDKAVGHSMARMEAKVRDMESQQKDIKKMLYNIQKQLNRIEAAQNGNGGKGNGGGKGRHNKP